MEQRNNRNNNRGRNEQRNEQPKRRRRVNIDKNVEVIVANNSFYHFIYDNPRINTSFDLQNWGDEEYITVGELRTMVNASRKIFEGFTLLIIEILDDEYTLEDLLTYLGLDNKYEEYFKMIPNKRDKRASVADIRTFIEKSTTERFKQVLSGMDERLRGTVIETALTLFKTQNFGDYNKMQVIRELTHDDIFLDAEETEVDVHI